MNRNIFLSFLLLALSCSVPPTQDEIEAARFVICENLDHVKCVLKETFVFTDDISNAQIFHRGEGEEQAFLAVGKEGWELWSQISEGSGIHVYDPRGHFSFKAAMFLNQFCTAKTREDNLQHNEFYHGSNLYMLLLLSEEERKAALSIVYWHIFSNVVSDDEIRAFEKYSGDFLDQALRQGIITKETYDQSGLFRKKLLVAAEDCFRVTRCNEIFAILLKLRMSNFKYTPEDMNDLLRGVVYSGGSNHYIGYDDLPRYDQMFNIFLHYAIEHPHNGLLQETKDLFRQHRYPVNPSWVR